MPSILTFRRGTAAQNDAFTGSAGEITVDTTNGTIRVHDGVTAGGSQVATADTLGALASLDTVGTSQIVDAAITSAKLAPGAAGGMKSMQVFTSSGTWTKPSGISLIKVYVTGGGGGGGGTPGDDANDMGGSGAAGGTAIKIIDVSSVSSVAVTIGSGGSGGSNDTNGNSGGTSSFGAYCSATGGAGGFGGNADVTSSGGTATGGDLNLRGGAGSHWAVNSFDSGRAAPGGDSYFGRGGMGGQNTWSPASAQSAQNGEYGSGGGGSFRASSNGGSGGAGIVVVEEYA